MSEFNTPSADNPSSRHRRLSLRFGALWAACAAFSLSGCGGGDSPVAVIPGGGGTGTLPPSPAPTPAPAPAPGPAPAPVPAPNPGSGAVAGAIATSAFGVVTSLTPLTVCDIAWQLPASATQQLDDPELEGLRLGMIVRVSGRSDAAPGTGTAADISSRPVLRGAVTAVNATGFIMGDVEVRVDAASVFAQAPSPTSLADIRVGDLLQVHGHLRPNLRATGAEAAEVKATRITRATQQLSLTQTSGMARINASGFALNNTHFSASAAVFGAQLPAPLRDGSLVHAVFDNRPAAGVRVATQLSSHLPSLPPLATVRMQGQVYVGVDGNLRLNDLPIAIDPSLSGARNLLSAGAQLVQATATLNAGLLTITEVRLIP